MNRISRNWRWVMPALLLSLSSTSLAEGARQNAEVIVPEGHESIYEQWGFAPAIKIDGIIYVSGVIVVLEGQGSYAERYAKGFRSALLGINEILKEADLSLDDVVDITTYHTDLQRQLEVAIEVRKNEMSKPHPSWTAVGTTALAMPEGVTEIRVVAHVAH